MISIATARKIILSMPEAEECQHQSHPDFRVNNKIFTTLWPDEARAVVKISAADQPLLFKSSPEIFSANAWSKHGWTNVHLRYVDARMFRQLVEDSWYAVAPEKVVSKYLGANRPI